MSWSPGETIVHHEVWRDRVWAARPLTVVDDADDRLLLWLPHGTRRKVPVAPAHRRRPGDGPVSAGEASHAGVVENLRHGDWDHADHVWDVSSLWVVRPGDAFSIWVSWRPDGSHLGWYVNLQRPYRRTALGIEAMDLMLDVVVAPDRTWRWKDEHELDELERLGVFDAATVATTRAEAARAISLAESGAEPFCDPWPAWRADPGWSLPSLPERWDDVPA